MRCRPRYRQLRFGLGGNSAFSGADRAGRRRAGNGDKGGNVGARLGLAVRDDMAACAPALGEVGTVIGIGCESGRRAEARGYG